MATPVILCLPLSRKPGNDELDSNARESRYFLISGTRTKCPSITVLAFFEMALFLVIAHTLHASTYIVFLPIDSPIYDELDTLNSLGYLDDYLDEIKPISRVEAARLTLEAQTRFNDATHPDAIAGQIIRDLSDQLHEEIGWIQSNKEDSPPDAILHPLDRAEIQYIYSRGPQRFWRAFQFTGNVIKADEGRLCFQTTMGSRRRPEATRLRDGELGGASEDFLRHMARQLLQVLSAAISKIPREFAQWVPRRWPIGGTGRFHSDKRKCGGDPGIFRR